MRFLAAAFAAAITAILPGSLAAPVLLQPGPSSITLTGTLTSTRPIAATTTSDQYSLYNRPTYPGRLGTAVVLCTAAQKNWLVCRAFVRLSRGVIVAEGLFPAAAVFRVYAVVGGTGYYANAGGTLTAQPLEPRTLLFNAALDAFG